MNMNDMTLLALSLGGVLIVCAGIAIYNALRSVKSGRTYVASVDEFELPNYGE
jgi:hypothetical protein